MSLRLVLLGVAVSTLAGILAVPLGLKSIGLVVIGTGVALGLIGLVHERRKRRALLSGRPVMGESDLWERYYRASGLPKEAVLAAWRDIANCLAVDPEKLRPQDRLAVLHTGGALPQTDMDDLDVMVRMASRRSGLEPPASLDTVDAVVRFLTAASSRGAQAAPMAETE